MFEHYGQAGGGGSNQPVDFTPDFSQWNTRSAVDFDLMFAGTTYMTPDVRNWNVGNARSARGMFFAAWEANPDVSLWAVTELRDAEHIFARCRRCQP